MLTWGDEGTRQVEPGLQPETCPKCWGVRFLINTDEMPIKICDFCGGTGLRPLEPPPREVVLPRPGRYIGIALTLLALALILSVWLGRMM